VRLRLLNGSNKRNYTFRLDNGDSFIQIASDGGKLAEPIEIKEVQLTPAERAEVIVDFSEIDIGDKVELMINDETVALPFVVGHEADDWDSAIDKSVVQPQIERENLPKDVSKEIILFGRGPHVSINGQKFAIDRIDFKQEV